MFRAVRTAAAALVFIVALGVNVYVLMGNLQRASVPGVQPAALDDFRDAIYYPTVDFLRGGNPYDVEGYFSRQPVDQEFDLYAPTQLIVHVPFALMPYRAAELTYFGVSILLVVVLGRALLVLIGSRPTVVAVLLVASAVLLSMPGRAALDKGQSTLPAVLGAYLAIRVGDRRPWLGGIGLALSLVKPQFGVPLALLLLVRGDRRTAAAGVGILAGTSLLVLPSLVMASGGVTRFASLLRANYEFASSAPYSALDGPLSFRVDGAGLVARLHDSLAGPLTQPVVFVVVMSIGALALVRLRQGAAPRKGPFPEDLGVGLICLATVVSVFHGRYDLLLLAWPLAALVKRFSSSWQEHAPRLRWALVLLLGVPVVYSAKVSDAALSFLDVDSRAFPLGLAVTLAFGIYAGLGLRNGLDIRPMTSTGVGAMSPSTSGRGAPFANKRLPSGRGRTRRSVRH